MAFEGLTTWQVFDNTGRRKYLTDDESRRFLVAAEQLLPEAEAVLCHALAATGCRVSEALALRRHHLDLDRLALTVKTLKRRRVVYRVIPIQRSLAEMMLKLLVKDDDRFWCMHRATAWRAVKQAMNAASVSGPMACCKGLRHGFGIRAATRNIPPNIIQRWMGHSSPTTTAIYIDAVGNEEREFAKRMWS